MATLADLKRKLTIGQGLKLVGYRDMGIEGANARLNKVRYIVKVQTNGIYLNEDKTAIRGAWLDFPKASLLEISDKGFKMYCAGIRDLTEDEKKIIANEPRDPKQEEIDMLSDGSIMYYRRKAYYEESTSPYLMGIEKIQGKRLTYKKNDKGERVPQIEDESIKGELSLAYEWC